MDFFLRQSSDGNCLYAYDYDGNSPKPNFEEDWRDAVRQSIEANAQEDVLKFMKNKNWSIIFVEVNIPLFND